MSSRARRGGPRPSGELNPLVPGDRSEFLHHDAAAEVEAWAATWQPLPVLTQPPPGYAVLSDREAVLEAIVATGWLILAADLFDDERLRLRNALDEACPDDHGKAVLARACETLADRCEALTALAMLRLPEELRHPALTDHVFGLLHNIAGLRLLRGIDPSGFEQRCWDCLRAGGIPCGWDGEHPDGRLQAWFQLAPPDPGIDAPLRLRARAPE
jgi:hypothetical protein